MRLLIHCTLLSLTILAGCVFSPVSTESTLYSRLGGTAGISTIVDALTANCVTDPRINGFFIGMASDSARLRKFKDSLISQVCETTGGPCKYAGRDMKTAHTGMGLDDQHFNAFVENLVKALDKFEISKGDQETLVGLLGPMRKDVVSHKS